MLAIVALTFDVFVIISFADKGVYLWDKGIHGLRVSKLH
jgi:hypothetical protein